MEIVQLDIKGMTCASCVAHVEKGIRSDSGVDMASVNLATEKATVSYDPRRTGIDDIIRSVADAGYSASVAVRGGEDRAELEKQKQEKRLKVRVILSSALSAPLLLAMFAGLFGIEGLMFLHNPLLQFILATPVQFVMGARFYRAAFASLRAGNPGMDVLVAMGTSAAYLFSIFNGFLAPLWGIGSSGLYFEASAVIITLVLLGKYLESRAKGRASEAIRKLMALQPGNAVIERDGEELIIPIHDVAPGDIVLVKPGSRIPVDGEIIEGITAVDESMITGESMPVEKVPGDGVVSGTMNTYGAVRFRARHAAEDSVLARIISVVEEAQGAKAPIQKLADRIAAVFVPVVLGIALVTFLLWFFITGSVNDALVSAVSVLVIACPCALGLATPAAVMVGTGIGAGRGILIRNGEVLQRAGKLTAVVLDKTGTITTGKPKLQRHIGLNAGYSDNEALSIAAALERNSEHPLALAIVDAAEERNVPVKRVDRFESVPGKGVRGIIDGRKYYIGTSGFLAAEGVSTEPAEVEKRKLEETGNTVVLLADGNGVLGLFALADAIKEHSRAGVTLLKNLGLEVYMITGDNARTAEAIAGKAGIQNVLAEVLPEGKAGEVKKLQSRGEVVAMVGDGVNDAPALAVADTGLAMGQGSDIALESSDITLMRGDLREIAAAIMLSRKTMKKIRQNLFWAFFYNTVGIPFAALGFLNPIVAGAAMAFSSVSVVSNSLSLKKFRLPAESGSEDLENEEVSMKTIIKVEGMSCGHCKMTVEKAALGVEGVQIAEVDIEKGELAVSFTDGKENLLGVKKAVAEAGYRPS